MRLLCHRFLLSNSFLFAFSIVFIYHSLRLNLHAVCIFLVAFTMRASLHKCVYNVKVAPAASPLGIASEWRID